MSEITGTRAVAVACVQLQAHEGEAFPERWPTILDTIARAAREGAELIVVPEGTVPNYVIGDAPPEIKTLDMAAASLLALSKQANVTVVLGGARYRTAGELVNSAWVVTPDGIAGYADKALLWHFDRKWFRAADVLEPIDTPVGRLGIFICADGRLPTIGAHLVARGAEILVVPTAWVTSGRDAGALENLQADLFVNVRARENRVPLVAANKVGIEYGSVAYCGKSAIVDAAGAFVARASERDEETIFASVQIGAPAPLPPAHVAVRPGESLPASLRIAITSEPRGTRRESLERYARIADATFVVGPECDPGPYGEIGVIVGDALWDPTALVATRLAGTRLFLWQTDAQEWSVRLARTRAAELRAYVIVFDRERAFAVDPDGVVLCGTFADFRLAAFTFDRARTEAWNVAPFTNVADGLRAVERLATAVV